MHQLANHSLRRASTIAAQRAGKLMLDESSLELAVAIARSSRPIYTMPFSSAIFAAGDALHVARRPGS